MKNKALIYGANGYSADLIIKELIDQGIKPILAGRNDVEIKKSAKKYSCDYRIFSLINHNKIVSELHDIHTVINCAGPFRFTAKSLIDACLESKTNYLDITGEIEAIEYAWQKNLMAKEIGVVLLPSTGFDVIPTDCLSKKLSEQLPNASSIELGLLNGGGISRGTLLTTFQMMGEKGKIRRDDKIIDSPIGSLNALLEEEKLSFQGISIPWGDVSSAYYSTNIPNITVYLGLPLIIYKSRKFLLIAIKLFSIKLFKKIIIALTSATVTGPNKKKRDASSTIIWGKIIKNDEQIIEAYKFLEGYNLTAIGSADALIRVMSNEVKPGTTTPSLAFGSSYMDKFVIERII